MESSEKSLSYYISKGHHRVQGWLPRGAISLIFAVDNIQKRIGIYGHVGEIGVHHGKLFILLYLMLRKEEKAVAVDVFENQEFNVDQSGRGNKKIFLRNMEHHAGGTSRLAIIQKDSLQICSENITNAVGGMLRLFSIDGGHTAGITYHDLIIANNSLCEGGVIIVDDYFNEAWPGVSEGTNRYFYAEGQNRFVPFLIGGNKVLFTTSQEYAAIYVKALQDHNLGANWKFSKFLGTTVICSDFSRQSFRQRIERTWIWKKIRKKFFGKVIKKIVIGS